MTNPIENPWLSLVEMVTKAGPSVVPDLDWPQFRIDAAELLREQHDRIVSLRRSPDGVWELPK